MRKSLVLAFLYLSISTLCVNHVESRERLFSAPPVPKNFRATPKETSIDLAWDDTTNEEKYQLFRSDTGALSSILENPLDWRSITDLPANTTAFPVSLLSSGKTFSFTLCAVNADGTTCALPIRATTLASSTPLAPSDLRATAQSQSSVLLTWRDNSNNEEGFKVRKASTAAFQSIPDTVTETAPNTQSFTVTGLQPNTTYKFQVCATGAALLQCTDFTSVTTVEPIQPPSAPSDVQAKPIASQLGSSIEITWRKAEGARSKVQRKDGLSFQTIHTTDYQTSFTDSGLSPRTGYSYRVCASNSAGETCSATVNAYTFPLKPLAPTILSAVALSPWSIKIKWQANDNSQTGPSDFVIRRSGGGQTNAFVVRVPHKSVVGIGDLEASRSTIPSGSVLGLNQYEYTDSVQPQTKYSYYVWSTNVTGSTSSQPAPVATPDGPDAPPSNVRVTDLKTTSLTLLWNDNSSDETGFRIEVSKGGLRHSTVVTPPNSIRFTVSQLWPNTSYDVRVCALLATEPKCSETIVARTLTN